MASSPVALHQCECEGRLEATRPTQPSVALLVAEPLLRPPGGGSCASRAVRVAVAMDLAAKAWAPGGEPHGVIRLARTHSGHVVIHIVRIPRAGVFGSPRRRPRFLRGFHIHKEEDMQGSATTERSPDGRRLCCICLEPCTHDRVVLSCASQGCASTYHASCASSLLAARHECPSCRRAVRAEFCDHADHVRQEIAELRRRTAPAERVCELNAVARELEEHICLLRGGQQLLQSTVQHQATELRDLHQRQSVTCVQLEDARGQLEQQASAVVQLHATVHALHEALYQVLRREAELAHRAPHPCLPEEHGDAQGRQAASRATGTPPSRSRSPRRHRPIPWASVASIR